MSDLLKKKLADISDSLNHALEKAYETSADKVTERENPEDRMKIMENFKKNHHLKTNIVEGDLRFGRSGDSYYISPEVIKSLINKKKMNDKDFTKEEKLHGIVNLGSGFSVSDRSRIPFVAGLHELGHAANTIKSGERNIKLKKQFSRISDLALKNPAPLFISGALAGAVDSKLKESGKSLPPVIRAMNKHPYLIASLLFIPELVEEGLASGRAANHLRKEYGFKEGLRRSKPVIPAFLSYALDAGKKTGKIGTSYLLGRLAGTAAVKGAKYLNKLQKSKKENAKDGDARAGN